MAVASGYVGGFECSFIGDIEDFECPLCLHVTRDPNLTSCCGQHFCQSCISRITADRKPCPFCKRSRFTVMLDKKQKRRVLDLKVKCYECSRGCSWTGPLGDLDNHGSKDCEFKDISCPNDCGMEVQRRRLADHLAKRCPKRSFECEYCGHKDTYKLILEEHISECPKYPVSCPNNCTPNMFVRASLKEHTQQVCPLQQVDCEYKSFGCTTVILRKDLARHMEDNIQQHMLLITKELKDMKEELSEAKEELSEAKEELSEANEELSEANEELSEAKEELSEAKEELSEAKETIATLTEKVTILEDSTLTVPFTFYVREISRLANQRKLVCSYTILTHQEGYRLGMMCIVVNKKLGFGIVKLDTENDRNLELPLRCTVVISILNQNNNQVHMTERSVVCVESDDDLVVIPIEFFIATTRVKQAVCNDRLLFRFDIVNLNK